MPTITKLPKKQPQQKRKYDNVGKRKICYDVYKTSRWRSLRAAYLIQHPCCELCAQKGKYVPADEVHHRQPFSDATDIIERQALAYDIDNLQALCTHCHRRLHGRNYDEEEDEL